jgi:hypothetical protein
MANVKIITGFARLRDDELDNRVQKIITSMTGNVNFATPAPPLSTVATALAEYQEALSQSKDGSKEKTAIKNQKRDALEKILNSLSLYVQANCQDNLAILLSSGYEARRPNTPIGILAKPQNFKVENGPNPGSLRLSVDKVIGADSYLFEYTTVPVNDATNWKVKAGTARTFTIEGLSSGQQYAFRIAGVSSDPTLVYSDIINRFAQ